MLSEAAEDTWVDTRSAGTIGLQRAAFKRRVFWVILALIHVHHSCKSNNTTKIWWRYFCLTLWLITGKNELRARSAGSNIFSRLPFPPNSLYIVPRRGVGVTYPRQTEGAGPFASEVDGSSSDSCKEQTHVGAHVKCGWQHPTSRIS